MKSLKFLSYAVFSVLLFACTQESELNQIDPQKEAVNTKATASTASLPNYKNDRLIVQYKKGLSARKKAALRSAYGVAEYRACALCPDGSIELWLFGGEIDIENQSISIQSGSGGPEGSILNVDYEFSFSIENEENTGIDGSYVTAFTSQIVPENEGVTIAVLDSGVDVNFPVFDTPFLYNAQFDAVAGESSGWDFVNNNDNCYDDYPLVHGTMVTYLINERLNALAVPHQIIPVKVIDHLGSASYFNVLCGLSYALPRADIVQMSLGWYDIDDSGNFVNDIFTHLIGQFEEQTLVVTSAGNSSYDNDAIGHFPSNYPNDNILAIAAANFELNDSAYFTNYGRVTVDFYAPGEDQLFYDMNMTPIYISGTSFAAPQATVRAAEILHNYGYAMSPSVVIGILNSQATPISYPLQVKYRKLIQ